MYWRCNATGSKTSHDRLLQCVFINVESDRAH
jgi:hypothetical protein